MRRLIRYSGLVILLIAICGVLVSVYRIVQFRNAVAELKAEGQSVSIADLNVKVKPEDDAMTYLNRVSKSLVAFETEMWADENVLTRAVDEEMIERFDKLCVIYPDVYPLLQEMASAKKLSGPVVESVEELLGESLEMVQQFRSCVRVLSWKARILAAQGKPDEAALIALQGLRLARLLDDQPTLVVYLVNLACREMSIAIIYHVVANHDLAAETRKRVNDELQQHDTMDGYTRALTGERAVGIAMLSQNGALHMSLGGPTYLSVLQAEIDNSRKEEFNRSEFPLDEGSMFSAYGAEMITPALQQVRMAANRVHSQLRGMRIIHALLESKLPADQQVSVDRLVAIGVPTKMTMDPMTGEMLKIANDDGWWKVYSVGSNKTDDGGNPTAMLDFVIGGKPTLPNQQD